MVCKCLPFVDELWPMAVEALQAIFFVRSNSKASQCFVPDTPNFNQKKIGFNLAQTGHPSWEKLAEILDANPDIPSEPFAKSRLRLFGQDKEPSILLYRDNAAWCPFSEKVWIYLEEAQISYAVKTIKLSAYGDKEEWFWDINPKGVVPVVDFKGKIVTESLDILRFLEGAFPDHKKLWPAKGSSEREWIEKLIPLDVQLLASRGVGKENLEKIFHIFDTLEVALKRYDGPYFLGNEFSVIDAIFTSSVERVVGIVPYFIGQPLRFSGRWPALDKWFDALLTRDSTKYIISDDFTTAHIVIRSTNPPTYPAGAAHRAAIDGTDGSWDLPLKPVKFPLGSDDGTGSNGVKEEAAKILVHNHENIVAFALLGLEEQSAADYKTKIDLSLRIVAHALLVGIDNAIPGGILPIEIASNEVAVATIFVRDHISTPRDLSFPAARQFRAHLHWLVKGIQSQLKG